jgi:hypothetical protein
MPVALPIDVDRRARFDALFDRHYAAVRAYVARRSAAGVVIPNAQLIAIAASMRPAG